MTSLAGATPAAPGGLDRTGVVTVEKIRAPCIGPDVLGFDSIDDYQKRSTVGVLAEVGEPDRLRGGIPVANRAVRQEGCLLITP